ncbi:hypothetical protein KBB27_00595 [Patescibacteria group bacterium]|nr:hypothetical protein [Patescibacteria group bacterium]
MSSTSQQPQPEEGIKKELKEKLQRQYTEKEQELLQFLSVASMWSAPVAVFFSVAFFFSLFPPVEPWPMPPSLSDLLGLLAGMATGTVLTVTVIFSKFTTSPESTTPGA